MIQLRQTADFSNDECEHVGIISRGGKGDAFDGVGTVFEFVYGVVDRSEGSCREECVVKLKSTGYPKQM